MLGEEADYERFFCINDTAVMCDAIVFAGLVGDRDPVQPERDLAVQPLITQDLKHFF